MPHTKYEIPAIYVPVKTRFEAKKDYIITFVTASLLVRLYEITTKLNMKTYIHYYV